MRGFRRRLLAVLVPLAVLAVLVAAGVLWADQQSARARLAEAELQPALARADAAEARAARAEASLTTIGQSRQAEAAATGPGYDQLSQVFSETALQTVRPEADYLRATGRHLGGASTFNVDAAAPQQIDADHAQIHTNERWLYDERDDADTRQRCFVEDSDQTYVMLLKDQAWTVDQVQLGGTRRSDCPAGT
jgi:type II secretory pathway pseudopilin PulG